MRLLRARYLNSIAWLILVITAAVGWGGVGLCVTHDSGSLFGFIPCSCPSTSNNDGQNHCDAEEPSTCTCACSVGSPTIPSSSADIMLWQARTVAMEVESSLLTVQMRGVVSSLVPSVHPPPSPDLLRSVILLI